ncbi:hypothetical protein F442_03916 [Plasmopara halstedii]|uniref:histone acetyltransferase n=1 Tax=Plasmopara halstedii TaxID=4781 RepID=A0A0P1B3C2_PLAHL|nr:hypothetical protein F442_03916 [Plasmopara halstedii]CEG48814.1 hypothetical protein F442_03916 [Plasmopara halstedii]|eukprot:XP_024585183.1 hypothetical protein F442_03916 [Plasmopara halstedii]
MSAPIDDLLYGGDDSGDDEDMSSSMRSFTGVPLSAAVTPPGGLLTPVPKPMTPPATPTPIRPHPQPLASIPPVSAAAAKQSPGSGQQMFQQMFALLKQMLPVEQYATLHSEMRKGNGNDIKSIVDIIKRIAGDTIFSSVIQKMDLTRTIPTTNTPGTQNTVKPEPGATASSGAGGRPLAARTGATTATANAPKVTAIAPNNRPLVASLPTLAAAPVAMPASIAAQIARPTSIQSAGMLSTPSVPSIKSEPTNLATTILSTSAPATAQSRNEALEKILFAKRLLAHAATCSLGPGVCQVKKCDDVRRVFKHSVSCGGTNGCSHCEQLKGLVKYHAKECAVGMTDHCSIPFCDGLRRTYAVSQATLAAQSGGLRRGTDSDDDDNTPLSSAVNKAKKLAKTKSPKNAASRSPSAQPLKRKPSTSSPGPSAPMLSPNFAPPMTLTPAKPQQKNVTANMTQEYGRLLQLILHVEKCTSISCPIGEECLEAKTILKQMSTPNPPARAKTYKQIYGHYKTCVAKNNTANCPMCKIGLLPISATTMSASPTLSPHLQAVKPFVSTANTATPVMASSPSGALKRNSGTASPSPRSPSKKPRLTPVNRGKATAAEVAAVSAAASELVSQELAQASVNDIRNEADVLTHTNIELGTERRIMMEGVRRERMAEQLSCQKEEWVEKDLFYSEKLRSQMHKIARRTGVELGGQSTDVMAYALHVYLKQVIEEMVEIAKQRGDTQAQALDAIQKAQRMGMIPGRPGNHMELTATDLLRVSCEDAFTKVRQDDLVLRAQLLEDAKREEQIEKERAKKRKKVDRSKLIQDERDEAEMDIEELAVKDLKERLLQQDKSGLVRVDGRVNESIASRYLQRQVDNQVTIEDANYWLLSQKPYIRPKLFVRAEAARIVTKSLR